MADVNIEFYPLGNWARVFWLTSEMQFACNGTIFSDLKCGVDWVRATGQNSAFR